MLHIVVYRNPGLLRAIDYCNPGLLRAIDYVFVYSNPCLLRTVVYRNPGLLRAIDSVFVGSDPCLLRTVVSVFLHGIVYILCVIRRFYLCLCGILIRLFQFRILNRFSFVTPPILLYFVGYTVMSLAPVLWTISHTDFGIQCSSGTPVMNLIR